MVTFHSSSANRSRDTDLNQVTHAASVPTPSPETVDWAALHARIMADIEQSFSYAPVQRVLMHTPRPTPLLDSAVLLRNAVELG